MKREIRTAVTPVRRDLRVGPVHRLILMRTSDGAYSVAFMKDEYGLITWLQDAIIIDPKDLDFLMRPEDGTIAFGEVTVRMEGANAYTVWGEDLIGYASRVALASDVRSFLQGVGNGEPDPRRAIANMAFRSTARRPKIDWEYLQERAES